MHSLLNEVSADQLRNALDAGTSVMDILNDIAVRTPITADEQAFRDAVALYENEVAKACYVQTS